MEVYVHADGGRRRRKAGPWRGGIAKCAMVLAIAWVLDARPAWCSELPRRPNVLVILVDDLGYGDLSSYGAADLRTPQIDRLIAAGLRFDNFYANCPVCSPTRAALLTGCYPDRVGVPGVIRTHADNSWGYLSRWAVLLPARLRQAGYHSAIVGKWHLGLAHPNTPNARGFDFFHGFLGDMMDSYVTHRRHGVNYMRRNDAEIDPAGHATDLFTEWACDYLRRRAAQKTPFFLYLAYNAPHTPIEPPEAWLARVRRREPGITEKRARLVALIEHLDDRIGRVMATLEETGLASSTIVFFTSDNGGQLSAGARNGDWRDGKQSMYEGGIRVPAGVCWPGRIEAGGRTPLRAMTMDIFATVCELAGVNPGAVDGRSFVPTLEGKTQPPLRTEWYFTRREGGLRYGGKTIEALRRGDWKLVQNSPFAPYELYHLGRDPRETKDLAGENRRKVAELSAALRRHIQQGGRVPWQPPQSSEETNHAK